MTGVQTCALTILKSDADNAAYIDSLGWIYFKKGLFDQAVKYLERAVRILEDPVIYDHLGDAYSVKGMYAEAIDKWERSLELDPDQEKIREKLDALHK